MRKRFVLWVFLFSLAFTSATLLTFVPETKATWGEVTVVCESTDGCLWYQDITYSTARNATVAQSLDNTSDSMAVGQRLFLGMYTVYRAFLYFDLSPMSIPDGAKIVSANVTITFTGDYSATDFNITIQNGQPTHPSEPLVESDYDQTLYSGNGGYLDTTGKAINTSYTFDVNPSWINKTGMTKLILRSSRDINGIAPSGDEWVNIATEEHPTLPGPKLTVTYSILDVTFNVDTTSPNIGNTITLSWLIKRTADNSTVTDFLINITKDDVLWKVNLTTSSTTDFATSRETHVYTTSGVEDNTEGITAFQTNSVTVTWSEEGGGGGGGGLPKEPVLPPTEVSAAAVPGLAVYGSFILIGIVVVAAVASQMQRKSLRQLFEQRTRRRRVSSHAWNKRTKRKDLRKRWRKRYG